MQHSMVLFRSLAQQDHPHQLFESGTVRSSLVSRQGAFAAGVFISAPTSGEVSMRSDSSCPGNPADCVNLILDMAKGITSDHRPEPFMVFGLLTLEPGFRLAWQAHVLSVDAPEGVKDAAAHAFGSADIHAVVEVLGGDSHAVLQHLLALADLPYVTSMRSMHTTPEDVRGFGSGAARGE